MRKYIFIAIIIIIIGLTLLFGYNTVLARGLEGGCKSWGQGTTPSGQWGTVCTDEFHDGLI